MLSSEYEKRGGMMYIYVLRKKETAAERQQSCCRKESKEAENAGIYTENNEGVIQRSIQKAKMNAYIEKQEETTK